MSRIGVEKGPQERFKPYPAYKETGVEWLGEIPASWEVKRIRDVAEALQTGPFGSQLHANEYVLGGYPVINPANLRDGALVPDEECTVDDAAAERLSHHRLQSGDILFARRGELGRCGLVTNEEEGWLCGTGCRRLRMHRDAAIPSFLIRLLSTSGVADWLALQSVGATMQNLNTSIIARIPFAVPPTAEQQAIAAFLDRETARIDALVAKKERLIELLQEQRTALITRAVTRGLDPTVPMRDSCVEWLGEIPAHWESGALRRFWAVIDCKHRTAAYVDQGMPIVSTTEVKPGRLVLDGPRKITQEDFAELIEGGRRPRRGDIIYSRNASIGAAAYVETDEPFCMGQDVCLITSERDQLFLAYQLNSPVVMGQIEAVSVGSTFERINVAQIKSLDIACPPMSEQRAIAAFLDRETARIDALVAKVRDAIARLNDLRTALISAAVTGKIDVRGEASAYPDDRKANSLVFDSRAIR